MSNPFSLRGEPTKITEVLRREAPAIYMVAGLVVVEFVWNGVQGLNWTPSLATMLLPASIFFFATLILTLAFPNARAMEATIYLGLWAIFSVFGVRLSYLAATVDLPLRDGLFRQMDLALGFDWIAWDAFAWSNPIVMTVLKWVYWSFGVQPIVIIFMLALIRPGARNRELLVATLIGLSITVTLSALLPAYGAQKAYGVASSWDSVLTELRAGHRVTMPYLAIITFPSFHACMALIYTFAMRGTKFWFVAVSILNGIMLLSICPLGYHYLVDLIAGVAIGGLSMSWSVKLSELSGQRASGSATSRQT